MSKYEALQKHLETIDSAEWNATFEAVEAIIEGRLPKSAYEYPAWWSNNPTGHSHSRAWIEAGWVTERVNILKRTLSFRRSTKLKHTRKNSAASVFGCMAGTITVLNDADLTEPLGLDWEQP